ncbi:MAG: 23S rRNA (uracil-C(5))-methyltransferase RlmCD [Candidatus Anoxychlamydiales bacterium]|nr:23S rRNA (uracil-C(5))-methyltransferase RlmCD [Candidatus Anoxychlamydiales bacterium]
MTKKQLQTTILSFNDKGLSISKDQNNNKIVSINGVIEDEVLLELNKKRRNIIKGKILEVIKPSKYRTSPKCSHFEMCGGCTLQNYKYESQLAFKEKMVLGTFKEEINNGANFYSIVESNPFEYRNKMEFSFSQNRANDNFLGLMIKGANRYVFNIKRCYLVKEWFSNVLNNTRSWFEKEKINPYRPLDNVGLLRNLIIREGINCNEKMVVLVLSDLNELTKDQINSFIETVKKSVDDTSKLSIFLKIIHAKKGSPTTYEEILLFGKDHINEKLNININEINLELNFKISPSAFFQPNTTQAQKLFSLALKYLNIQKDDIVYDLYTGTGTLGLILSKLAKKVIGIELNIDACKNANQNIKNNNIDNFTILNGDVGKVLNDLISKKEYISPDVVCVDPPRAGLDDLAIENIKVLNPKKILYISCNIKTQKQNIDILKNYGYIPIIIAPIDQFPHTTHIENIIILKRT